MLYLPLLLLLASSASALWAADDAARQWEKIDGARFARLPVPLSGKTGFSLLPASVTGIYFTNSLPEKRAMTNLNLLNGSGVALGDYDQDGLCDIYFCNLNGTNALYKNLGHWKFRDVTDEAGAACPGQTSTGAVFADINGDGALDLLVTSMGGPNACFLNDGHGHFQNVTAAAGLVSKLGSTSMALADIDGNGTLDLYVANYGVTSILRTGGALGFTYVNGRPVARGRYAQRIKIIDGVMYELGEPDALYLNDGKGKFSPVSWTDGTFRDENGQPLSQTPWDQGLSVAFHDLNEDGFPDLYVCNDAFTPDRCWINDGHGHFRALPHLGWRSTSYFSMGVDFADIDRDGLVDFFVVDMLSRRHRLVLTQKSSMVAQRRIPGDLEAQFQIRRNTLFLNRGDGTYAEIANYSGVSGSEWTWSGVFLDVDLDGWEDILVSNGFAHDVDDADSQARVRRMSPEESKKALPIFPRLDTPNVAFRNQRDLTFQETGKAWGFDSVQISNGLALADLDNDGDLDVVVNCLNGPALIYRNETAAARIAVRLRGKAPNTQGIGARITVRGGPVSQSQEVISGGRYMSGDDPMRVFAAGLGTNFTVEVVWRAGARSVVSNCLPNRIYEIDESAASEAPRSKPASRSPSPLFKEVSELLAHRHHEELFDDFARQPLLPNRLSQLGPGVAWFDIDGDGRDDLIIPAGKGGTLSIYRNDPQGGFQRWEQPALSIPAARDQTTVLARPAMGGISAVLVGSAIYEDGKTNDPAILQYVFQNGAFQQAEGVPGGLGSAGPLALGDLRGDGRLSLFLGGRVVPGRYPEPAPSLLYHSRGGSWELDRENSRLLEKLGLVSGAVWSDLDGDGLPELIVAAEWSPIRVFKFEAGKLREVTVQLGLEHSAGWWTGVTTGDLDGDGRLDIIAANWGLNSSYHASPQHPARLYFGQWDDTGTVGILEAEDDPELGIVPRRDFGAISAALPFIQRRFQSYAALAEASIATILGDQLPRAQALEAWTFASTVFFNRGERFEAVPMPREAQFAPAFAVCVADFNGDGREDVFLSQNFFGTQPEVPALDAGRGLLLRGAGAGKLEAVPGQESGLEIYGEQRGGAVADYDQDGRADLVVTQNGGETKLYHNENGRPGLRIRLIGPEANPNGIGASIRLRFGERIGPTRELHAGSGYWSQDSAVQVMGTPEPPTQIWVRWPGGQTNSANLPAGCRDISVNTRGEVNVLR